MINALNELNDLKLRLALTPEEKEKIKSYNLLGKSKLSIIEQEKILTQQIKNLNKKMSKNSSKIDDLKMENEELKIERNKILGVLQTLRAKISRGEI